MAQQASASSAGQGTNPREIARHRVGIVYVNPSVSIDRLGYDSNVLNSEDDPKGDFTAAITPAATFWIPFQQRALLTTNAAVGFVHYQDFTTQRTVNPRINVLGELYARRLTFWAEAGTASDFRQPNNEIETRVKQHTDNVAGGVKVTMQRGLSIGASAYRRTQGYDSDETLRGVNLSDRLDRNEQGYTITVQERVTSLTTVGVLFETREDRFDQSPERDADGYRLAGTIALAEKALINGSVEVGYRHVKATDPSVPAFNGLVSRVAIGNRVGGTTEMNVTWDREMQYSLFDTRPYYLTNAVSVTIRRQVAGEFDASAGASRNQSRYKTALGAALPSGDRQVTTSYSGDIGYRVNRDSRAAIGVTHSRRTSTLIDSRGYSTTQVFFSLNYAF
jgi:hypothetical protein